MLPPPALRRYLNFSRLNSRSLDAIARVVERDDEFRARVADAVHEQEVGRAGWLWLTRPDGWDEELEEIEAEARAEGARRQAAREERSATRKLAATQAAARRAETALAATRAELESMRAELAGERAGRVAAEDRARELEASVADLSTARTEVVRNLKEVESRLVDRSTEVNAAKARIRALEAEARDPLAGPGAPPVSPPEGDTDGGLGDAEAVANVEADAPAPSAGMVAPATADAAVGPGAGPAHDGATARPDPEDLAAEVARAADGAAALADALGRLSRLLVRAEPAPASPAPAGDRTSARHDGRPPPAVAGPGTPPQPSRVRRVPVPLPGGMFDDTVEAAEHLLRTPNAVLVVDGYNVTMQGWPELDVAGQRRRLVTALSDIAARTATRVELVFDGAEVEPLTVPTPSRQLVRVRFSDPDVEADDVVIDLVARLPAATPVVVASSDGRVRHGARRHGANLLHARQLVAVLRR